MVVVYFKDAVGNFRVCRVTRGSEKQIRETFKKFEYEIVHIEDEAEQGLDSKYDKGGCQIWMQN